MLAFRMELLVILLRDTSTKRCLYRSGKNRLFDMTNNCPFSVRISVILRIVPSITERGTYAAAFFLRD
jgi:hypothetical protein